MLIILANVLGGEEVEILVVVVAVAAEIGAHAVVAGIAEDGGGQDLDLDQEAIGGM